MLDVVVVKISITQEVRLRERIVATSVAVSERFQMSNDQMSP